MDIHKDTPAARGIKAKGPDACEAQTTSPFENWNNRRRFLICKDLRPKKEQSLYFLTLNVTPQSAESVKT